jgi:hypothetical protein
LNTASWLANSASHITKDEPLLGHVDGARAEKALKVASQDGTTRSSSLYSKHSGLEDNISAIPFVCAGFDHDSQATRVHVYVRQSNSSLAFSVSSYMNMVGQLDKP